MPYTPVELRHVSLKRGLLGYRRDPVDRLVEAAILAQHCVDRISDPAFQRIQLHPEAAIYHAPLGFDDARVRR